MAATFHPELSGDPRIHQAFLDLCGTDAAVRRR
jgi:glutamine amidotransferase PdxT